MLDPTSLYLSNPALLEEARVRGLPLIVALSGYAEAGHVAVQIEHTITEALPHEVVARFDLDQLYDYRARNGVELAQVLVAWLPPLTRTVPPTSAATGVLRPPGRRGSAMISTPSSIRARASSDEAVPRMARCSTSR